MNIWIVDDDELIARGLALYFGSLGHEAVPFMSPVKALARLDGGAAADLVISDITMPAMDGFHVALEVAHRLGSSPPRTLLMSGNDHLARVTSMSPGVVLGMIRKPFCFRRLNPLLDFVAETRRRCPGRVGAFCSWREDAAATYASDSTPVLCDSCTYASCAHYETVCGKRVQAWVSTSQNWCDLPAYLDAAEGDSDGQGGG